MFVHHFLIPEISIINVDAWQRSPKVDFFAMHKIFVGSNGNFSLL